MSNEEKSLIGKKDIEEYKKFAFKDDVLKLAIGVILGNAFNKVVYGISDYLVTPLFTYVVSKTGEGWREWTFEPILGLKLELGKIGGIFVDFLLISIVLYLFYVRLIGGLMGRPGQKQMKVCPFCFEPIDLRATKCPRCTGDLNVKTRRTRSKNQGTKNSRG